MVLGSKGREVTYPLLRHFWVDDFHNFPRWGILVPRRVDIRREKPYQIFWSIFNAKTTTNTSANMHRSIKIVLAESEYTCQSPKNIKNHQEIPIKNTHPFASLSASLLFVVDLPFSAVQRCAWRLPICEISMSSSAEALRQEGPRSKSQALATGVVLVAPFDRENGGGPLGMVP